MSGGAFEYAQYRIDDIIDRIEEEIERATCERPPLVSETGVAVKERIGEGCWRYDMYPQFRSIQSAEKYFREIGCKVLEEEVRDGERYVFMQDVVTGQTFCINTYTSTHYAPDENGEVPWFPDYSNETLAEFRRGIAVLKRASIYAQRIDWLLSGDDGEETFNRRLKEQLGKLEETKNEGKEKSE